MCACWECTVSQISESDWTSPPSLLPFLKKVFIYVFVPGLSCSMGTVSCRRDPLPGEGSDWPLHWGLRVSASGPAGKAPPLPFLSTLVFPWYLLSFIASADKTNLQSWFLFVFGISVSQPGPWPPAVETWSLNYWTSGKSLLVLKLWPIIPWANGYQWVPNFAVSLDFKKKKTQRAPVNFL